MVEVVVGVVGVATTSVVVFDDVGKVPNWAGRNHVERFWEVAVPFAACCD